MSSIRQWPKVKSGSYKSRRVECAGCSAEHAHGPAGSLDDPYRDAAQAFPEAIQGTWACHGCKLGPDGVNAAEQGNPTKVIWKTEWLEIDKYGYEWKCIGAFGEGPQGLVNRMTMTMKTRERGISVTYERRVMMLRNEMSWEGHGVEKRTEGGSTDLHPVKTNIKIVGEADGGWVWKKEAA
ncbi:hypothetical protein EJ05DRAFT_484833 [Pseudovirgaria hyperparasitica]|uniref:Uncharacterized protein n=1 Tax=Pseudovirgaria hyperparasitica TaxID=470096 RepID=A0A6A6WAR9_9PEZI|nr:uncharacterized protein EJ05DRAFT_484833 [Pseudovirgaria hyperparasitica]KAF2759952.1 hypothetical protein EJ05DRAFT_484833 [Pseudovirgaria hyperparasitica]